MLGAILPEKTNINISPPPPAMSIHIETTDHNIPATKTTPPVPDIKLYCTYYWQYIATWDYMSQRLSGMQTYLHF